MCETRRHQTLNLTWLPSIFHAFSKHFQVITFAQDALGKSFLVDGKMKGPNLGETRAPQAVGINSKEDFFKMAKIAWGAEVSRKFPFFLDTEKFMVLGTQPKRCVYIYIYDTCILYVSRFMYIYNNDNARSMLNFFWPTLESEAPFSLDFYWQIPFGDRPVNRQSRTLRGRCFKFVDSTVKVCWAKLDERSLMNFLRPKGHVEKRDEERRFHVANSVVVACCGLMAMESV